MEKNRWYKTPVELAGTQEKCYLEGQLIHEVDLPDPQIARRFAVLSVDNSAGETIVKFVNPPDDATEVVMNRAGAKWSSSDCKVVTLTGNSQGENSIDTPTNIALRNSMLQLKSLSFQHIFPPHSFAVLRIMTGL